MLEKNLKLFHTESALSFANYTLLNGIFLIGIALLFGANTWQIGLLTAIPLFSNIFQIFSSYLIARTGNNKKITIYSLFASRFIWVIVALVAAGLLEVNNKVLLLAMIVLVSSILTSIGNLSLMSWIAKIVPTDIIAQFFGRRNIFATSAGIFAYLIGALFINFFNNEMSYAIIFLAAIFLGIFTIPVLHKIDFQKSEKSRKKFIPYLKEIFVPIKDPNFKPFLYFTGFWSFSITFAAPFFIVYMLKDLSLAFFLAAVFLVIDSISRIYGMKIWGKFGDRFGAKPILMFSATISATIPLWFIFINKGNFYLLPIIFIISAFSYAAVDIALGQLLFKNSARKNDSIYMTSFYGTVGIFSALGPICGGLLATFVENNPFLLSFGFPALAFVFAISFIMRVSTLPLIRKIKEREARDINDVRENLKTLKYVSFVDNFYSIANLISKFVLVPQEQLRIIQKKAYVNLKNNIAQSIELSQKAARMVGETKNIELVGSMMNDIHYILLNLELPKKYSEYKAINEIDKALKETYNALQQGRRIPKAKAKVMKFKIKQDKNILEKFFNKVILLKKKY